MVWTACCVLLFFIIAFYWGRVIKLVLKQKKLGGSAHFLPPETLGRVIRVLWYPTVAVWILTPLLAAVGLGGSWFVVPMFDLLPLNVFGLLASIAALLLTMVCWRKMGRDWRMGIDPNEKNNLIVNGPYTRIRHPIYALQQALAVTSFLTVPVPVMLVVMCLEIVLLNWEAWREERHLIRQHGDVYRQYMRAAGRFFPKLLRG
jgi:protein-S-isoprenylcysteine O-methyltransferase Ste14